MMSLKMFVRKYLTATLNIACELAAQGRESRKVGTIFVLEMMRRSCSFPGK